MGEDVDYSLLNGLVEVTKKVEATLQVSINEHRNNFIRRDDGLDFLDVKSSLLLTYLIDLTVYLRDTLLQQGKEPNKQSLKRLIEMRTVLDKMRSLDKKLRYQIDKLLTYNSSAATAYATSEDPLLLRPGNLEDDEEEDGSESEEDDNNHSNNDEDSDGNNDDTNLDDDLAAARMTLAMTKTKRSKKKGGDGDDNDDVADTIYKAPRISAVPYTNDVEDRNVIKERRIKRKLRASEIAQTLRNEYTDIPEIEDVYGGTNLGLQAVAARKMAAIDKERTKYEEDNMIRLPISKLERKERKRIMREENSNLNTIANISNIVRESSLLSLNNNNNRKGRDDDREDNDINNDRHMNGRRKRQAIDNDGRLISSKGRKPIKNRNSFQEELYGGGSGSSSSKKKKKRK